MLIPKKAKKIEKKTDALEYNTKSYARAIAVVAYEFALWECVMDNIYLNDENGRAIPVRAAATRTSPMLSERASER